MKKRAAKLILICTLTYTCFFIGSYVELLVVEAIYPRSYLDGQIYSMQYLNYKSLYKKLEELIRQNPALIKGYKDTITDEKYLESSSEYKCISGSLYIEEDNRIFYFTVFDTKHGLKVSLNSQRSSWDPREGTILLFTPPPLSFQRGGMLSFKECLNMCDSFERNILSHIGSYKKDKIQGVLVWYYWLFLNNIPTFLPIFFISVIISFVLLLPKIKIWLLKI